MNSHRSRQDPRGPLRGSYQGQADALLNPLANVLTCGHEMLSPQLTGYFTNAALSNCGDLQSATANARRFYTSAGVSAEQIDLGLQLDIISPARKELEDAIAYTPRTRFRSIGGSNCTL